MTAYRWYVGIDWATETHQVVVLDAERCVVHERTVRHEGAELETFARWLGDVAAGGTSDVAVALEVPRGAVVDALLAVLDRLAESQEHRDARWQRTPRPQVEPSRHGADACRVVPRTLPHTPVGPAGSGASAAIVNMTSRTEQ